jgi:hypothetical protein
MGTIILCFCLEDNKQQQFMCFEAARRPAEVQSVGLLAVGPT